MSGSGATYDDEELKYLYRLLKNLSDVIPEGNAHDFTNYVPDPQKTKDFGKFRANTHPHLFPDSSTILGPYRSNLRASTSGAPSPPTPMPQPVVLHASVSRAAWSMTCTYSAIPSHRWLAYTPLSSFQCPPICARVRLVSIRNQHTLAHDSRKVAFL
ncbi:hypothetical protein DFH08DRAFT_1078488 [Mycena albidolilacea]|uniref:Uncharacterized protein n=1 Tax=Mycena albidolilacea TaxID=1033008 RepID=A0AAD7EUY5_9AGAR|nr:hypothetical protein DFH08DRAFT_1078488 [Mycena albidolilacea]